MENQELEMFRNTVKYCGDVIFVKPLCDFFEIDYENQVKRIYNDQILKTSAGKNTDKSLFGDLRERVTLTKKGFLRWIQLINPQIVQVNLREKLTLYQEVVFDYLFGNIEEKRMQAIHYARLDKLKKLHKKISNEIILEDRRLKSYIKQFFAPELPFYNN